MDEFEPTAPCPHCDNMPYIELRFVEGEQMFNLVCDVCALEIGEVERGKAIREWNANYRRALEFSYTTE